MPDAEFAATVGFAIGAGVATFFSPCVYALLPGYLGFYVGTASQDDSAGARAGAGYGLAAAAGIVTVFAGVTLTIVSVGRSIRPILTALEFGVAVVLLVLGVVLLMDYDVGWHVPMATRRDGVAGFAAFGAVYAVAATGCVAPLFVGIVTRALTLPPVGTVAVIGAYAISVALLMISATVAVAVGHTVGSKRVTAHAKLATRLGGAVLMVAGGVQLWLVGLP